MCQLGAANRPEPRLFELWSPAILDQSPMYFSAASHRRTESLAVNNALGRARRLCNRANNHGYLFARFENALLVFISRKGFPTEIGEMDGTSPLQSTLKMKEKPGSGSREES